MREAFSLRERLVFLWDNKSFITLRGQELYIIIEHKKSQALKIVLEITLIGSRLLKN